MTEFTSDEVILASSSETVFNKLSNLENLRSFLNNVPQDKIPQDKLEQFHNLVITADSITIPGGPTGAITLAVKDKIPHSLIRLEGVDLPIKLSLEMRLSDGGIDSSKAVVAINADIPMMLKPMIKGPLQKIVDQFAQVLTAIPFEQ